MPSASDAKPEREAHITVRNLDMAYGDFVILTSAPATGVTDWEQGGAPVITIAGPQGADASIAAGGAHVTTGAIRLLAPDLARLRAVPLGTPLDIVALGAGASPGPCPTVLPPGR